MTRNLRTRLFLFTVALIGASLMPARAVAATNYSDRFVWVFGWSLGKDEDVAEITRLLDQGAAHGINGAVMSFGLDTLCKKTPDYFRRLNEVRQACEKDHIELIPSLFSVGYGGGSLSHNRNLAEGLPVRDGNFVVHGNEARYAADSDTKIVNGDFEDFAANKFKGFNFHDQPGEISFVDTQVKHAGKASLRLENFTANEHGHARVMQQLRLKPYRCYRLTAWVKTEGLQPTSAFQISLLAGKRSLAPRTFKIPATTDWRKISTLFNSQSYETVNLYAGLWGGKAGKLWFDDWAIEEVGPINVLHRPGTPVTVKSSDGATTYTEGKDFATLTDPDYSPSRVDRAAPPLKLLPGGRIKDGERLQATWYHSMVVHDSQITVCMAEPELYDIYDHEAALLAEKLHPRKILLNMDEIRMGGTCRACEGRNMGELLGECITRQSTILRRHNPGAQIYIWSDMLDPNHNAHGDYYLVKGDYTGSWDHVPKDLTMAVWGGKPREKSLQFFDAHGFPMLISCYYDANDLKEVKGWLDLAEKTPNVRGFMYTPWLKKYDLLGEFGDMVKR